ncbi:amino acid ABC transporter substrate-binding protein [Undibacterium parvum]|uniref:Amino acid ABC transporter substrate-binding protein n=2 Tax=Undibacterium TaxID=401469 RepID=A0A6M4A7R3_9BURK|nr:amino acid ABC transporter substrate-binding protein [Undibacterium parvum]AZP12327.1 amino acid ABC transporter substrate-binding protein [Undibacterium parvum]QJQ06607.1 amino acid ABC transporter substrate-binding protein [Undibacterium piscinae]
MKLLLASASLMGSVLLGILPVQAQELTGTLKKIKDSGVITLGVRDSSIPFSYIDDKQAYQGYSIDLCKKVVLAVQRQLGVAIIKTVYNPVTSATRIPLMANGTIDLECGSTTNNLERQKQVAFAPTMFLGAGRLMSKKSSKIRSLADLRGKTVVSTAGTANLKQLTLMNAEQNLGITIVAATDHAESFLMLETGRAAAFAIDDILMASLAAGSKNANDYELSKEALSLEPYGIMLRRDDIEFKKMVDAAVSAVYTSGEINAIYAKWFLKPIPPKGINMQFALSPQLQAAFMKPNDSGDPASYASVPEAQKHLSQKLGQQLSQNKK